jgi:alpha/beta superfamily hydrolase
MRAGHPAVERLFIDGPAGPIEALVERPATPVPGTVAICCHPHPLFGGTMQNKVVHALARAALDCGVPAIRFNFRGVGGSHGSYDDGVGETDDALAVAQWGEEAFGADRTWSMGFSFGSFVAFGLATSHAADRLVTIAPPVQRFDFSQLAVPRCPWLVVQGDQDELVNHDSVLQWTTTVVPAPQVTILAGADHFFHGRITQLRATVVAWLGGEGRGAG